MIAGKGGSCRLSYRFFFFCLAKRKCPQNELHSQIVCDHSFTLSPNIIDNWLTVTPQFRTGTVQFFYGRIITETLDFL